MRYILASASPRRRQLIRLFGLSFESQTADVDESSITNPDPRVNVVETARLKVAAIAESVLEPALIVGADTTVSYAGRMLNKPGDSTEARLMLQMLRGVIHQVHTGLVVHHTGTKQTVVDVATIDVPMRTYSDREIDAYIATGDPLDKAGSYAIQHPDFRPVSTLAGCYAGVVGLPLCHLSRLLRMLKIPIQDGIAEKCQAQFSYDCPVYESILNQTPPAGLA